MKENELRDLATCAICKKKLGESFRENHTLPIFWKVAIRAERHILDESAMRRQAGLEMMVGSVALAGVLSPGEEMTRTISSTEKVLSICESCMLERSPRLVELVMGSDDEEEKSSG